MSMGLCPRHASRAWKPRYNKMIMIGTDTDLHYKVVDLIRRFYPDTILVAGLGELRDIEDERLHS